MLIRAATADDIDTMLEIAGSMSALPHWTRDTYLRAIEWDTQALMVRSVRVAEVESQVVGLGVVAILLGVTPAESEIEILAVDRTRQREGIGRSLLIALMGAGHDRGAAVARLEVRASNTPAIALYRGAGFRQTGSRPLYYKDPAEDAVLMEAVLVPAR